MVGMDKHSICTMALQRLGEDELVDGSPTYKACGTWYKHVLSMACARYNWTFLARECELEASGEGVRGAKVYRKPVGCLKLTYVCNSAGKRITDWRLTVDGIVVAAECVPSGGKIYVRYQTDLSAAEGGTPDDAPDFNEGVICLLASEMCMHLRSDAQHAIHLKQEADMHFARAITHDRQQDWGNAIDPVTRIRRMSSNLASMRCHRW